MYRISPVSHKPVFSLQELGGGWSFPSLLNWLMAFAEIRVASLIRVDNLLSVKRNEIMPTTKGNDQMVDSPGIEVSP